MISAATAIPAMIKNFFILPAFNGLLYRDYQAKQILNLYVEFDWNETIFTILKTISYGRSIMVALLRGNCLVYSCNRIPMDFS